MKLNCKTFGLEHKLCNPPLPLVSTKSILSYLYSTPKVIFPAYSSTHITILHWFCFLSHKAKAIYCPFNSLSHPVATHLANVLLPHFNTGQQLWYLFVSSKRCGFSRCWFLGFFLSKRNLLPLHLWNTDNCHTISMLGHWTDTVDPILVGSLICLR